MNSSLQKNYYDIGGVFVGEHLGMNLNRVVQIRQEQITATQFWTTVTQFLIQQKVFFLLFGTDIDLYF